MNTDELQMIIDVKFQKLLHVEYVGHVCRPGSKATSSCRFPFASVWFISFTKENLKTNQKNNLIQTQKRFQIQNEREQKEEYLI